MALYIPLRGCGTEGMPMPGGENQSSGVRSCSSNTWKNSYCDITVGLDQRLKIASLTQATDKVPRKKNKQTRLA